MEEAWNNFCAGYVQGVASTLVLASSIEDEQRLSVGVLMTILTSEIKSATPALFLTFKPPKVVMGLIGNHFHKFW